MSAILTGIEDALCLPSLGFLGSFPPSCEWVICQHDMI